MSTGYQKELRRIVDEIASRLPPADVLEAATPKSARDVRNVTVVLPVSEALRIHAIAKVRK